MLLQSCLDLLQFNHWYWTFNLCIFNTIFALILHIHQISMWFLQMLLGSSSHLHHPLVLKQFTPKTSCPYFALCLAICNNSQSSNLNSNFLVPSMDVWPIAASTTLLTTFSVSQYCLLFPSLLLLFHILHKISSFIYSTTIKFLRALIYLWFGLDFAFNI